MKNFTVRKPYPASYADIKRMLETKVFGEIDVKCILLVVSVLLIGAFGGTKFSAFLSLFTFNIDAVNITINFNF